MVHSSVRSRVRTGINLWLSPGRMAIWCNRGSVGRSRNSTLVAEKDFRMTASTRRSASYLKADG
jgi:hypothetical protein